MAEDDTTPILALKRRVSIARLVPDCAAGLLRLADWWQDQFYTPLVVTSTDESHHSERSFHYVGAAFDVRTRDVPMFEPASNVWAREIATLLGPDWDVVVESTHLHLELDREDTRAAREERLATLAQARAFAGKPSTY